MLVRAHLDHSIRLPVSCALDLRPIEDAHDGLHLREHAEQALVTRALHALRAEPVQAIPCDGRPLPSADRGGHDAQHQAVPLARRSALPRQGNRRPPALRMDERAGGDERLARAAGQGVLRTVLLRGLVHAHLHRHTRRLSPARYRIRASLRPGERRLRTRRFWKFRPTKPSSGGVEGNDGPTRALCKCSMDCCFCREFVRTRTRGSSSIAFRTGAWSTGVVRARWD